jgi:4-oxalomesaconate tautomerase
MTAVLDVDREGTVTRAALLRTARKLFDGVVFG